MNINSMVDRNATINLIAGGAITQSGTMTSQVLNAIAGVGITLGNTLNSFGIVSATGGAVTLYGINNLTMGASNVTSLVATATGAISEVSGAAVTVAGLSTLTAGTNIDMYTNAGNNSFGNTVTYAYTGAGAHNALYKNTATGTGFAISTLGSGNLSNLSLSFNSGATATLGGTNMSVVTGNLSATGGTLTFGAMTVSGGTTLVAGNAITQSAAISLLGTTAITPGTGNVTLTNSLNEFGGAVSFSATSGYTGKLMLRDINTMTLGTMVLGSGGLIVGATGAVTQIGAITSPVGALTQVSEYAVDGPVTLTNAGNDFGIISVLIPSSGYTGTITVIDINAINIGTMTDKNATINLTAGGVVTQSGMLTAQTLNINAGTGSVTLGNSGNDIIGTVNVYTQSGYTGRISLRDMNALNLGTIQGGSGGVYLIANGNITQSGALTTPITAVASITELAGSGNVTLDNTNNDFGGLVNVSSAYGYAGRIKLYDKNSLEIGSIQGGNNGVTAQANSITSSGIVTSNGRVDYSAGTIDINNQVQGYTVKLSGATSGGNADITIGENGWLIVTTPSWQSSVNGGALIDCNDGLFTNNSYFGPDAITIVNPGSGSGPRIILRANAASLIGDILLFEVGGDTPIDSLPDDGINYFVKKS